VLDDRAKFAEEQAVWLAKQFLSILGDKSILDRMRNIT
jgi:hypothetical protein